jgi:branched-chain amino acid transport system ATP-binding protein
MMSPHGVDTPDGTATLAGPASTRALTCAGVSAGYGDVEVVSGVSLDCRRGEIVAVIGPNGSGKSTLLKSIARVLPLRAGTVHVDGRDTAALTASGVNALGLQYVPQTRDVFPSLSVEENLAVGRTEPGRLEDVLSQFPILRPLLKRKAGRLSGGERKAVAIARAFLSPDLSVLVLDEPSTGLSPRATADLWPTVAAAAARDIGIVLVEQRVDDALRIADRMYMMVAGGIALHARADEFARKSREIETLFLGGASS